MVPLSPADTSTRATHLRIWVIVNPASGHGKALKMTERIMKSLSKASCDGIVYRRSAADVISEVNTELKEEMQEDVNFLSPVLDNFSKSADPVALFVRHKRLRIDVVNTEETIRGPLLTEHIARAVVRSRIEQCRRNNFAKILHIFAPIGGDGTLNEVVNGMCSGTLQAVREAFSPDSVKNGISFRARTTSSPDASTLQYWNFMEEKSALNFMMPPILFISAGTGNDFSKLHLCCRDEVDFIHVIKGICTDMSTPDSVSDSTCAPSSEGSNSTCFNDASEDDNFDTPPLCTSNNNAALSDGNNEAKTDKECGFAVYDVDIGRIFFPRSGNKCFFINECSSGMSCDVIRRCENYKESKVLSAGGGLFMFALASAISVIHMHPRPRRIMPLPDTVVLPSERLPDHRNYASPFIPPYVFVGDSALCGLSNDLQFIEESMRSASIPLTDPLAIGADYYVYTRKLTNPPPGSSSTKENSFFSTCPSRACEVNKNHEILAAVSESASSNPNGRWVCFQSSTVVFANGRWFGGGLQIAPHADPTDGRLSLTNWVAGFARFVFRSPSLYNGKHAKWSTTTLWDSRRCIVDSNRNKSTQTGKSGKQDFKEKLAALCETDGELREQLPAVVEVCGVVKFLVPKRLVEKRGDSVRMVDRNKKGCAVL